MSNVDVLKDAAKVEEMLSIQISHKQETNELVVERRDVEEATVPTREQMAKTKAGKQAKQEKKKRA